MLKSFKKNKSEDISMPNPSDLAPEEFELLAQQLLDEEGVGLKDYRSQHLEVLDASDGSYEIDVTARFTALGARFLVLIECKRWARPIEREQVQVLEQKRVSIGAHKAILISVSPFRRGAVRFAKRHRIALVAIQLGELLFKTRYCSSGSGNPFEKTSCRAHLVTLNKDGKISKDPLGRIRATFLDSLANGPLFSYLRDS